MSVKPPYDHKPYRAMYVKGAQTTQWRGGKEKKRSRKEMETRKDITTRETDSDSDEGTERNQDPKSNSHRG